MLDEDLVLLEEVDVITRFGGAGNCEGDGVGEDETSRDSSVVGVIVMRVKDSALSLVSGVWETPVRKAPSLVASTTIV